MGTSTSTVVSGTTFACTTTHMRYVYKLCKICGDHIRQDAKKIRSMGDD